MRPEVKFCGLTRPGDAALAASLAADYVGVILVGGPRLLTLPRAHEVLSAARGPKRVAVVRRTDAATMASAGRAAGADILQVHADPTAGELRALRVAWPGGIWAVVRIKGTPDAGTLAELFATADAVVVDAAVAGGLGGSGQSFDWSAHAALLGGARTFGRLVLAGGLHSDNIPDAVCALAPDVVDVSSGVEDAPGLKSPDRMRAFARAVANLSPPPAE